MTLVDVALDCVRRGWYVFPCKPRTKKPITEHGFKDASNSEDQISAWWTETPDANPAIATGPSTLCAVDVDHGIRDAAHLSQWLREHGIPETYAVRTGRRPEFGVQLYYSGAGLKSTGWSDGDACGDIRCSTGYVMAAGCIHPESGEAYEVLWDNPILPVPESVRSLTTSANDPSMTTTVDDGTAEGWKTWLLEYIDRNKIEATDHEKRTPNGWWIGIQCPWVDQHGSGPGNESSTVLGILDGKIGGWPGHENCIEP